VKVPSHERAIFLALPPGVSAAAAFRAVLTSAEVRAHDFPALWDLSVGAIDILRDVPSVATVTVDALDALFAYFARVGTPEALDALVTRTWAEIPDRVREYWLGRGAFSVLKGIFRVGPRAADVDPPAAFRADRRANARFEATYRLHEVPGAHPNPFAPPEEGSLVLYPFDVRNVEGRAEAGLPPSGSETILEVFAYEAGRERHRRFLASVAASMPGARVLDPDGR